ncbi:MAG: DNA methylase [Lachnospiraceae bacterium]|nr:DNA methylase [Lachnospiraceae bacterium]
MEEHCYVAIDLKSFYASVECRERGLDPLRARLVVADPERTSKTICLAVSPALKAYGIPGRPRLFEVEQILKNRGVDYIVAPPRMSLYMRYSTEIYQIYMKYVAPEDMHVYSCDEVFLDVTHYLKNSGMSAHELTVTMIRDVLKKTGITATAGIGSNLYLCKIAMDIVAKHIPADEDGVRIAELNERTYREKLWSHTPITDFWRVGHGTARRLAHLGLYTMGDIARYSEQYEDSLYQTFGINAELLIDHAWGWEPCTIQAIKEYRPESNSLGRGQVLQRPYDFDEAAVITREMIDLLSLDLVEKGLVTDQIVLYIGYDVDSLKDPEVRKQYAGEVGRDHYGREVPKHAQGTTNLKMHTASTRLLSDACMQLYESIVNPLLLVRRISVTACRVLPEGEGLARNRSESQYKQLDLFSDPEAEEAESENEAELLAKEKALQLASIAIKKKFGKNAILKGTNLKDCATARERNRQIGGHKA